MAGAGVSPRLLRWLHRRLQPAGPRTAMRTCRSPSHLDSVPASRGTTFTRIHAEVVHSGILSAVAVRGGSSMCMSSSEAPTSVQTTTIPSTTTRVANLLDRQSLPTTLIKNG